jgi:mono/diheme cytochrome c family protein
VTRVLRAALIAVAAWLVVMTNAPTVPADDTSDAREAHDFLLSCAGCHKLDASGSATVPSLRGVDRLLAKPGGRDYVLRVPGVASAPLSDERLAALLDWVFVSFGNHAAPQFTAAEVHEARTRPFVDPKAARAALD